MAHNSMGAMGDMAKSFVSGEGGFSADASGNRTYSANPANKPDSAFAFDPRTMNTQAALNGALHFGGGVLPQGMGMMAGILPAALKIEEHKKMRLVADKYYEKYIKDFNNKYGFSAEQIEELVKEFKQVTEEICRLIPDKDMKKMYEKYIESYPTMYLSMIPAEALQTKLAVKCVTENGKLRKKIEDMSSCVSTLVKNLTDLQISAGIPPIVNLMFESMPDPLTAITDPMYHKYNDAIVTYHKLLSNDHTDRTATRMDGKPNDRNLDGSKTVNRSGRAPGLSSAELLRLEPVHHLKHLVSLGRDLTFTDSKGDTVEVKSPAIAELAEVMENMQTQSGCQPFGDEWNHAGPTPAMNPAMCLAEKDRFQPGNPRHNMGRTNVYQAKRDQNGNAHWVESGKIPALSAGGPQMVQHTPQPVQNANQWAGMAHMPGVDPRPMNQGYAQQQMQPMPQQMQNMPQFNQAYPGAARPARKSSGKKGGAKKTPRSSASRKKKNGTLSID